ncbi:cell wall protein [Enterococcus ureilyticus]|uniref:Cell wall protein n=1 Tax=Enterococcus ureilyticus TaxID=1131292 RepID=A0A1E5HA74_9ENTE|nr:LPXTG cell wall anchor domain-containing protein [Enterococcus ureilyticus]MBM7688451.1 LPXTG-motif cell wall-anchored protein [Enterococcus ureilyticus]OEG21550.1 cell wall protein [Enterococcus ureilyticus]
MKSKFDKRTSNFIFIVILFLMCISSIMLVKTKVQAKELNDVIQNVKVTNEQGEDQASFQSWDIIQVHMDWSIPNGSAQEGDTTLIDLPAELDLVNSLSFDVLDENGSVVATAVADKGSKTVLLTYTDFVETHSNVKGTLQFSTRFDTKMIDEYGTIKLVFPINKTTEVSTEIEVEEATDDPNEVMNKWSWFSTDSRTLYWEIRVNASGQEFPNAVVTDTFQTNNYQLVPGSIKVTSAEFPDADKGIFDNPVNKIDITDQVTITYLPNGFTVDFGDMPEGIGYLIAYDTTIDHQPYDQEEFSNLATLESDQITIDSKESKTQYSDGSGTGTGEVFSIELVKTSEDGEALAGAEFDVFRDSTNERIGQIVTNTEGLGKISNLLQEDYTLIETKAPLGFILDTTPIKVSSADFKNQIAFKKVTNKAEPVLGAVRLVKIDQATKEKLSDVIFELQDESGNVIQSELTTDENGELFVQGLVAGRYQFVETKALKDYILDGTPISFEISSGQKAPLEIIVENKKEKPPVQPKGSNSDHRLEKMNNNSSKEHSLPKTGESQMSHLFLLGSLCLGVAMLILLNRIKKV